MDNPVCQIGDELKPLIKTEAEFFFITRPIKQPSNYIIGIQPLFIFIITKCSYLSWLWCTIIFNKFVFYRKSPKPSKEGKKPRVWDLGGTTKDLADLDRCKDRPEDGEILADTAVSLITCNVLHYVISIKRLLFITNFIYYKSHNSF